MRTSSVSCNVANDVSPGTADTGKLDRDGGGWLRWNSVFQTGWANVNRRCFSESGTECHRSSLV